MTDRNRRRRIDIGLLVLALLGIFSPIVVRDELQDRRANDQADLAEQRADDQEAVTVELAERDKVLTGLIAHNEELAALREADRLAFELKVCVYGNDAKRTARRDANAALTALFDFLRMSPHSAAIADAVEAEVEPLMSTAATSDHDCDGDGVIGDDGDYP